MTGQNVVPLRLGSNASFDQESTVAEKLLDEAWGETPANHVLHMVRLVVWAAPDNVGPAAIHEGEEDTSTVGPHLAYRRNTTEMDVDILGMVGADAGLEAGAVMMEEDRNL